MCEGLYVEAENSQSLLDWHAGAKEQKREPCPATSNNNVQALAENLRFTGIYLIVRCSAQKTDSKKNIGQEMICDHMYGFIWNC